MTRRALLRILGVLWLAALGSSPLASQTNRPELLEVRFRGNEAVPTATLTTIIQNRATTCRSAVFVPICWASGALKDRRYLFPRQVRLDSLRILAYYRTVGYREAQVDTAMAAEAEGVRLEFTIREGRPVLIDDVGYTVYDEPQVEGLLDDLPIARGRPFSTRRLEEVRDTLTARLRDAGYAHAEVLRSSFIPRDDPYSADVAFDIDPGPRVRIGEITIERNVELGDDAIRRALPFRTGQLFRPRLVEEGQRNLYGFEIVRNAAIEPLLSSGEALDTIIPIRVQVVEGDKHRVRAGAGWSTAACVNAEARWTSRNFRGGARRLSVFGGVSNILAPQLNSTACEQSGDGEFAELNGRLGVDFVQPTFLSPRTSLTTSAFIERESLPEVFIREAIGVSFALTRAVSRRTTASLFWQPQLARLSAAEIFFCTSFLICNEADIGVFRGANWLAPIGTSLVIDRSNSVLNRTRGWTFALDLEHASRWTGSDFAYNRAIGELSSYFELGGGAVLALRGRGGVVAAGDFEALGGGVGEGIIHPQKRFYAGGAGSVRGYGENQLGPRVLKVDVERLLGWRGEVGPVCGAVEVANGSCNAEGLSQDRFEERPTGGSRLLGGNVELRIPLPSRTFQLALFADVGQVWDRGQSVALRDLEVSPGVGIRYFSPVGPIRIDLGFRTGEADPISVITSQIEPFDPNRHDDADRIRVRGEDGSLEQIAWVALPDLRLFDQRYPFDAGGSVWQRLQLHFSIGQAF